MATSAAGNQLYPFSTEDGKPIPLDIIRPTLARIVSYTDEATFTLPADYEVITVRSSVDAVWTFESATVVSANADLPLTLLLYADTIINAIIPIASPSKLVAWEATGDPATLWVQAIQKWVGLGLNRQLSRR